MPRPALFVVKATIAPEREAAFNEWYNTRRAAEAAEVRGLIAMRRYSEEALRAFAASDTKARFGGAGDRVRFTYRQFLLDGRPVDYAALIVSCSTRPDS